MTKLNITKPEQKTMPISVKSALGQTKPKKLSKTALYGLFGPDVGYQMWDQGIFVLVSCHQCIYTKDLEKSIIDLSPALTDDMKVAMIVSAVNYLNPNVHLTTKQHPSKTKGASLPFQPEINKMAHKDIEDEVGNTGITSLPMAKEFYDVVSSSSSGSRYVYLAKHKKGQAKVAVRFKGSTVSVRMEPYTEDLAGMIEVLGLTNNGHYASGHFQAEGDTLVRYMNMMLGSLMGYWDVAPFNEQKIRNLGA